MGVMEVDAYIETKESHGPLVRLQWLRDHFKDIIDASDEHGIQCVTRAFLLHLVRCTLFFEKVASRVLISYLTFFRDLHQTIGYSWGARSLTYSYRQLGIDSRSKVHHIAGNLTLLQKYVYYYLNIPLFILVFIGYMSTFRHFVSFKVCLTLLSNCVPYVESHVTISICC